MNEKSDVTAKEDLERELERVSRELMDLSELFKQNKISMQEFAQRASVLQMKHMELLSKAGKIPPGYSPMQQTAAMPVGVPGPMPTAASASSFVCPKCGAQAKGKFCNKCGASLR